MKIERVANTRVYYIVNFAIRVWTDCWIIFCAPAENVLFCEVLSVLENSEFYISSITSSTSTSIKFLDKKVSILFEDYIVSSISYLVIKILMKFRLDSDHPFKQILFRSHRNHNRRRHLLEMWAAWRKRSLLGLNDLQPLQALFSKLLDVLRRCLEAFVAAFCGSPYYLGRRLQHIVLCSDRNSVIELIIL